MGRVGFSKVATSPKPRKTQPVKPLSALPAACLAALAAAAPALAQDEPAYAPDPALLQQVEAMARSGAGAATAGEQKSVRVEVKVGKLDPRLRLAPCAKIEPYLPPGLPVWGQTRMGLRCTQGTKLWNVSLPITVSVFTQATVVNGNVTAGSTLDASQLGTAEVDIAAERGAAIADPALAVGRILGRNLMAGATLRQTDLKARQFFAAGETVRVVALGPGWQVITEGQAVNAGIEGQTARVRTESGRILNARPSGDRQVELTL